MEKNNEQNNDIDMELENEIKKAKTKDLNEFRKERENSERSGDKTKNPQFLYPKFL